MGTAKNPGPCSVDECEKPAKTRGMCGMHTERVRKYGTTELPVNPSCRAMGCPNPRTPGRVHCGEHIAVHAEHACLRRIEAFLNAFTIDEDSGCWNWDGSVSPEGYGRLNRAYAHRFAYELLAGEIPTGLHIDHLCRNRACVNPDHLEPVTCAANLSRGMAPTAVAHRTNRCQRGHAFTPENTYLRPDNGVRQCRACAKLRAVARGRRRATQGAAA